MNSTVRYLIASLAAIALIVVALWLWAQATALTAYTTRPEVAQWGVRSGAVSAAAAAQLILLTFVVGGSRRREFLRDLPRLLFGLAGSITLVSAVALGLAGR